MKCEYLSDLRFLTLGQREYLAQKRERLTPREEDIRDWNDALNYLTDAPPENTAQGPKAQLVQRVAVLPSEQTARNRTCFGFPSGNPNKG